MSGLDINNTLSLVIPTYNRARFIDVSLQRHLPILHQYHIDVYVVDNASTDETREVVGKYQAMYPRLNYHVNDTNVGPDRNFEIALTLPETDYVWLLGDTSSFNADAVKTITDLINEVNHLDVIVLNDAGRVRRIPAGPIEERGLLLRTLGWHMTQISTLIYSRPLLQQANFARFRATNFMQTGIIFEYLANKEFIKVWWLSHVNISGFKVEGVKKVGWLHETFEIWMRRWPNLIMSLPPAYTLDDKQITIKMHNRLAKVFSLSKLMRMRAHGVLSFKVFLHYYAVARQSVSNRTCLLAMVLSILPKWMFFFKR